jgi:hypothetical protein
MADVATIWALRLGTIRNEGNDERTVEIGSPACRAAPAIRCTGGY